MKLSSCIIAMLAVCSARAQQPVLRPQQEQQLERLAEREEGVVGDDDILQQLESFRLHPVNLNTAGADELRQLQLLTDMQIRSMLQYRLLLGKFIHVYELQAVPNWDVTLIHRLLPLVTIHDEAPMADLWKQFRGGVHTLMLRLSQRVLPKSIPDTGSGTLMGSPQKILMRYRYDYKNALQYGLLIKMQASHCPGAGKRASTSILSIFL
jgi:hypothetical protein